MEYRYVEQDEMKIELTDDKEFIHRCLTSPKVWRMGVDDFFKGIEPSSDLLSFQRGNALWVKTPYGAFIGLPTNFVTYDCHIALLPVAEGLAVDVSRAVIDFAFSNTKARRLNASVPSFNLLARRLAEKSGFRLIGINEKSFLRDGVLHDQHFYGISK